MDLVLSRKRYKYMRKSCRVQIKKKIRFIILFYFVEIVMMAKTSLGHGRHVSIYVRSWSVRK